MHHKRGFAVALLLTMTLALAACAKTSHEEEAVEEPAKVEKVEGSQYNRLVLEEKAVERLGIETAPVHDLTPPVAGQTAVAYSALVYDADGAASVYTQTAPLTYVRAPVTVVTVSGPEVVLSQGPPVGTQVVTVGAAELLGIDSGIGGNE
jgi:ABC-type oligopeptide transport system substrate-binding subunit